MADDDKKKEAAEAISRRMGAVSADVHAIIDQGLMALDHPSTPGHIRAEYGPVLLKAKFFGARGKDMP